MSNNDDAAVQQLMSKIDREKNIIHAANQMRQATNNPAVNSRVDSSIRDARRNIQYFEQTLRDIQTRQMGGDMSNLSISGNGGPPPPQHGVPQNGQSGRGMNNQSGYGGGPDYGSPGPGGYSAQLSGGNGVMPPRPMYAQPGPQDRTPRARPNYSKLGMLVEDAESY